MASTELTGTASGPGFGNKTDDSTPTLTEQDSNTRYGIQHTKAYSGGSAVYRSGTVAGPGSGNKLEVAGGGSGLTEQDSNTRYDMTGSEPYQGATEYGSGTYVWSLIVDCEHADGWVVLVVLVLGTRLRDLRRVSWFLTASYTLTLTVIPRLDERKADGEDGRLDEE